MTLVAASNMALKAAKEKIGEANLTLSFVKARQEKTSEPVRLLFTQLQTELFQQVENWNAVIGAARQGIEGSVIKVNTDFFNGDERACRQVFESGVIYQMPIFAAFREAIYDEIGLRRLEGEQLVNRAKHFLSHVARHCNAMKINPKTLAWPPSQWQRGRRVVIGAVARPVARAFGSRSAPATLSHGGKLARVAPTAFPASAAT